MTFIEAVQIIATRPDLELCSDTREIEGTHPCICVYYKDRYKDGGFIGKLRWPKDGLPAEVDPSLVEILGKPAETKDSGIEVDEL